MKNFAFVAVLALSLALNGCSAAGRSAKAYPTGVIFPLKEAGGLEYDGHLAWTPASGAGRLFLATTQYVIWAIDLSARTAVWRYAAPSALASAPVLSAAGLVLAESGGRLVCLDPSDGRLLWERKVDGFEVSWVVPVQDRVILAGKSSDVLGLDSSHGGELWRFQAKSALAGPPLAAQGGSRSLLLFTEDGTLHSLTLEGKRDFTVRLAATLSGEASVEGKLVFFSSLDGHVQCFDLAARKTRWRVKLAGPASCRPLVRGKRLILWTDYGVLFCLDRSGGDILWWTSVASRLPFPPVVVEDQILLSVSSPRLQRLSLSTGKETAAFDLGRDLEGPPLWAEPLVLVNAHDPQTGKGRLVFLRKDVGVRLDCSKKPPQGLAGEIVFAAKAVGFFRPKYEFFLVREGREESVQKASEQDYWSWYPDSEGAFVIKVRVTDAREKAEAEMPFTISADTPKRSPVRPVPAPGPGAQTRGGQP
ncbi:MAG: hypothetical protein A2Y56_01100 [Candidatus Aminicenantes bacterium RBG_13_63_10]|nr:MAG: hypothetical protein A2Y56_01100 [Candidatus Aminicenantes bacterium RBG_13_63_10]